MKKRVYLALLLAVLLATASVMHACGSGNQNPTIQFGFK
jgi:hypothetical protein